MSFQITWIQLITICAIANGLVFSILLFEKKDNRKANRFLSLLVVSMCLTFTPYVLNDSVWHTYRWLAWLPFSLSYWIGPSFYFYVRTLTRSGGFKRKELWHFSPIVLNYIHSTYHLINPESNPFPNFHHFAEILESGAIASILIYMWFGFKLVSGYQQSLLHRVSNLETIDLQWIKRIIFVIVSSFILILCFLLVSSAFLGKESLYQWNDHKTVMMTLYAGILYWLSISGYRQSQTLGIIESQEEPTPNAEFSTVVRQLNQAMENDKLYRNPEISLMLLSKTLDISERAISESINKELGKNFYQFINEYRVAEIKERLIDPDYAHLKIISLALDAGFNSKASFNRVFKSYTGLTPQQYKSQNF